MGRKRCQPGQIIDYLREAEVLLAKGDTVGQMSSMLDYNIYATHLNMRGNGDR